VWRARRRSSRSRQPWDGDVSYHEIGGSCFESGPPPSGAERRIRLGQWWEKPLTLEPGIPSVSESESEPAEDSEGGRQSSTSMMSMKRMNESSLSARGTKAGLERAPHPALG
jgi:hypothetical protein